MANNWPQGRRHLQADEDEDQIPDFQVAASDVPEKSTCRADNHVIGFARLQMVGRVHALVRLFL